MFLVAFSIIMLPLSQSASAENARDEQARLNRCIQTAQNTPLEAYEDSLAWLANGNRPKARYCNATALLALEKYQEAAPKLEALARAPDTIALEDRILYLIQAGNAWLSANRPEAAIAALSEAIDLEQNNPDLYKDRAAAYLILKYWMEGMDDLNAALALLPADPEALSMRARVHLETNNLNAAKADMEQALTQEPTNIDILVLRGDIREAIRLRSE